MTFVAHFLGWIALLLLSPGVQEGSQGGAGKADDPGAKDGKQRQPLVELPADYVRFARIPEAGRQPRLQVDAQGRIALLFFRGEGTSGDLFLARSSDEAKTFAPAVRVNSRAGSVSAPGGVHMAALALGSDGRAHVAWVSADTPAALCFAREKPEGGFDAEQNLGSPEGLCSSAAVAVDREGQIYVIFAALDPLPEEGEKPEKRVQMRRSTDGATFSEAVSIEKEKFSVSEHSALAAHVDAVEGSIFVLYRASKEGSQGMTMGRDMRLITSEDRGENFKSNMVDNWRVKRDPRSLSHLSQDVTTTLAAYEARGHVYWSPVRRATNKVTLPLEPRGSGDDLWRSAASVAANKKNEVLLAWLQRPAEEPTAQPRVHWQVWLKDTRAFVGRGQAPEPPGSSSPAVLARADGGFTIVY